MKSKTAKPAVLSLRCAYRTSDGRQCRLSVTDARSGLCPHHRSAQIQTEAADHFPYLSRNFQYFQTAQGINYSLMNLYQLLAQNCISPRRAAFLSYISSLLLRTLPQIDADRAAGITDPTKPMPINVSAPDEAPGAGEEDEDSSLATDSGSEAESVTSLSPDAGSTRTWDHSILELDLKKKPS